MLILLNKNKIYSCMIAICLVGILFYMSIHFVPNQDIQIMKVSSNIINDDIAINNLNNNLIFGK